ncbi:hypothetical protein EMIHUDRAFT_117635 [Emiliania huxleyi CCMP1516]|uniref:Uncharacterized protein n=2 Tax=Emiliania huxleyi TaxID=2903 RepID=A0A0D3J9U7_EMIH1|nr:hypothetical protein EMIHUDRAFT_117635 [Emiliania huxleyi CCMP1516]EOD20282.1 hypothetical protein EMIHUDRAFT_117635 [Emiliania huxleyi CCMP1516]|eukprot:XP_005772711.1 hypothetical protein EMIHUDRAFT_117635 [Emiliania huxleyi CCMP1516]
MADISATPSSEKMANPITDYSGDPVTLDDNLGLRPRARAVSGLRPCARTIFGSAPPIIQLALSIATSIFVVTVDFVHYFLTAARRLVVCARERFTAACALSAAPSLGASHAGSEVYCVFTILLTVILAVAVSGPTPAWSQETVAGAGAGAGGSVDSRATQRGFAAHASSLGSAPPANSHHDLDLDDDDI